MLNVDSDETVGGKVWFGVKTRRKGEILSRVLVSCSKQDERMAKENYCPDDSCDEVGIGCSEIWIVWINYKAKDTQRCEQRSVRSLLCVFSLPEAERIPGLINGDCIPSGLLILWRSGREVFLQKESDLRPPLYLADASMTSQMES
jgi:hypothetical protein